MEMDQMEQDEIITIYWSGEYGQPGGSARYYLHSGDPVDEPKPEPVREEVTDDELIPF